MAQFDVHARRNRAHSYIVDIQTDFLASMGSRLVIPLMPHAAGLETATRLNPTVVIDGTSYMLLIQSAAAVPVRELGERVISLADRRDDIIAAIDFLVTGI